MSGVKFDAARSATAYLNQVRVSWEESEGDVVKFLVALTGISQQEAHSIDKNVVMLALEMQGGPES
jgi:hypothetical protein